eukprot:MONOS_8287.1-p1 / transcript=MONOS_8287.1 / gene=MONOS_8287 / organism=Monocercomonoides_exilis_PA203 / gene_product=unspecified product / transcript_product=unspecified product / location=Mono_scaffold00309:3453-4278(-) / protein_length=199 / sequence_SO=supercontig / SO=protein_coding / is_pseudo=false
MILKAISLWIYTMTEEEEDFESTSEKALFFEETVFNITQKNNEKIQQDIIQQLGMRLASVPLNKIRGLTANSFGMLSVFIENHSVELTSSILSLLELIAYKASSSCSSYFEEKIKSIFERSRMKEILLNQIVSRRTPQCLKNIIARILAMARFDLSFEETRAIADTFEILMNKPLNEEDSFITYFSFWNFAVSVSKLIK